MSRKRSKAVMDGGAATAEKNRAASTSRVFQISTDRSPVLDVALSDARTAEVAGCIVRVIADIRASERDSLDVAQLRADLVARGARGVSVVVRPVAEAPPEAAKERAARAQTAAEAVVEWFEALPATVPAEDREAALALVVEIVG